MQLLDIIIINTESIVFEGDNIVMDKYSLMRHYDFAKVVQVRRRYSEDLTVMNLPKKSDHFLFYSSLYLSGYF
jgi:hypothetical protein